MAIEVNKDMHGGIKDFIFSGIDNFEKVGIDSKRLRVYMPRYIQEMILQDWFNHYPQELLLNKDNPFEVFGVKVLPAYENKITVSFVDGVYYDKPALSLDLNNKIDMITTYLEPSEIVDAIVDKQITFSDSHPITILLEQQLSTKASTRIYHKSIIKAMVEPHFVSFFRVADVLRFTTEPIDDRLQEYVLNMLNLDTL